MTCAISAATWSSSQTVANLFADRPSVLLAKLSHLIACEDVFPLAGAMTGFALPQSELWVCTVQAVNGQYSHLHVVT